MALAVEFFEVAIMTPPTAEERLARIESKQLDCVELQKDRFTQIQASLATLDLKLETKFVSQTEFRPVRNIVYGMVGIIMVAVLAAVINSIIRG
jgi:hypothetical protein